MIGTSGCVLASRLSEDPAVRVLVLEAGGSGKALLFSRWPSTYSLLWRNPKHVHQMYTVPQPHAGGVSKFWPRAKLLGGCSAINAMMAQYGAPQDFDEWARITGDESWAWGNFRKYFAKFEKCLPDAQYHKEHDISYRGATGPLRVGYLTTFTEVAAAFVESCVNAGIPRTPDFNGPNGTEGVNRVMTYVDDSRQRVSSETAYLTPDVLARPNLRVVTHAQVTKVLFDQTSDVPRATGVEFAYSKSGPRFSAHAKREVILSAGAVQTPQILLLSGVGPAAHLAEHGIPVVRDLPAIGDHLVDHPIVDLHFKRKKNDSLKYFLPSSVGEAIQLLPVALRYAFFGDGPMATNMGECAAFIRVDDPRLFPDSKEKLGDALSEKGAPDVEYFATPLAYKQHAKEMFDVHTYGVHCYLLRPRSTGSIRLQSADPWAYPVVNPNYLKDPRDVHTLRRGVRLLTRVAQTPPVSDALDGECTRADLDHRLHELSDEELDEVIRQRCETVYHPACTCRMAPDGALDNNLRVHGVRGLRVCDASAFPTIASGHTAGACFAIAEKLADDLKAEYAVSGF
uniref:Glucose-methanol-choline oxidoreductase N-terminal domain-containing protein n=1 Tax=Schizophyllum commune (strain H4-8 / FGSC 9210) TaxID=578458 RepID=D8QIH8_SCHCM